MDWKRGFPCRRKALFFYAGARQRLRRALAFVIMEWARTYRLGRRPVQKHIGGLFLINKPRALKSGATLYRVEGAGADMHFVPLNGEEAAS